MYNSADGQYDPQYRNPCWSDKAGNLRCLPYVYLMGGFHSGATSLGQKLSRHPDILTVRGKG